MNDKETEGEYKWVSGTYYAPGQNYYDDWGPGGEPNNKDQTENGRPGEDEDCVQMRTQDNFNWRWNDDWCGHQLYYVCQATKDGSKNIT